MVNEGATGTYIVKLATQPTANVTVAVTVAGSSDVTVAPILLTFTNSNWSIVQTVTVTAAGDTDMVDDIATLNHAASGGGYDSVTGSVTVTVDDEAPVPLPTLSIAVVEKVRVVETARFISVDEEVGTVEFAVTLSAASTGKVTVEYATEDIPVGAQVFTDVPDALSATAGEDYTAVSGTLIFAPGETSKTISLQIIDEPLFEQAQDLFRAVLSNPSGATIAAGQGRLLFGLVNGDPLPPVSVMAAGLASTGSPGAAASTPITFTITQSGVVSWRNVHVGSFLTPVGITGTATANTDFEVTTEDLNFAAGTTRVEYTLKIKVAPSITDITDKTATFGTNLLVDVDAVNTNPEDTLQYQVSSGDTAVATVSPTALPPPRCQQPGDGDSRGPRHGDHHGDGERR